MRYRRDEAFRYEFKEPLPATFTIDEVNGNTIKTSNGKAKLIDLSLKGMKISTSLSIPVEGENDVTVSVRFQLNKNIYTIQGKLVWKRQYFPDYHYGVHFLASPRVRNSILQDLKLMRKQRV